MNASTGEDDDEETEDEEEQISSTAYRFFVEEDATILERSISRVVLLSALFFSLEWGKKERKSCCWCFGLSFWSLSRTSRSPLLEELLIDGTERKRKRKKSEKKHLCSLMREKRLLRGDVDEIGR